MPQSSSKEKTMRTAIYCRVSSPGQKNSTSLPEQERLNREHAADLSWKVSEPHVSREVEGGENRYRPQMDRLWAAIEAHEVDAVVIDVLDRLSRDEGDQGAVYHHADRHGVVIELASEDIDETEHGRNLRSLSGIMARMERVEIRRRTQRGRKAHVASGKMFAAAWPLYGYLWKDPEKGQRTAYVIDPETAPIVVRIYEEVAAGVPLRRIVARLAADGVPTPGQLLASRGQWPEGRAYNTVWGRQQLLRILHHPACVGQHSAYRWQSQKLKTRGKDGITRKVVRVTERAVDASDRVLLPDVCPAIVSPELVAAAQKRLAVNQHEQAGRVARPDLAILRAGIGLCGYCGGPLLGHIPRHR